MPAGIAGRLGGQSSVGYSKMTCSRSPMTRMNAREIMAAIASAPAVCRDAVIAVDLLGLSYREAARSLHTREATIATRLHRGRQHVARELTNETTPASS